MPARHSPVTVHHTLGCQERIKSKKLIDSLFSGGNSHSVAAYPLRAVWMVSPSSPQLGENTEAAILVSVSKRHFRRAVKRNRVKRQIREAYRLNKQILTEASSTLSSPLTTHHSLYIAFIWQSDKIYLTSEVEERMKTLLHRIAEKI